MLLAGTHTPDVSSGALGTRQTHQSLQETGLYLWRTPESNYESPQTWSAAVLQKTAESAGEAGEGPAAATPATRAKCREHDSSARRLLLTASLFSCGTMKPHSDLGAIEATLQGQGVLKSTVSGSNHLDHMTT